MNAASKAAGTLSGGEQQMLAMGRAPDVAAETAPCSTQASMGLSPIVMQKSRGDDRGAGSPRAPPSCWSSRTPRHALSLADHGRVMEGRQHRPVRQRPKDLLHDESVRKAYLGED